MENAVKDRIARVKELLGTSRYAAMATVNVDGSPHNTPFFFMHDGELEHVYWSSHPDAQHSKNIERTGQLFVVLYDKSEGGGLYIRCEAGHELSGGEFETALSVHNEFRARENKVALRLGYYSGPNSQRMYGAKTIGFWVNITEHDTEGHIVSEYRHEVERQRLIDFKHMASHKKHSRRNRILAISLISLVLVSSVSLI